MPATRKRPAPEDAVWNADRLCDLRLHVERMKAVMNARADTPDNSVFAEDFSNLQHAAQAMHADALANREFDARELARLSNKSTPVDVVVSTDPAVSSPLSSPRPKPRRAVLTRKKTLTCVRKPRRKPKPWLTPPPRLTRPSSCLLCGLRLYPWTLRLWSRGKMPLSSVYTEGWCGPTAK